MGLLSFRSLLLLAAVVAILAYLNYIPYPADMENRTARTIDTTIFKLKETIARVSESLGWGSFIVTLRELTKPETHATENSAFEVKDETMAGIEVLIFRPKTVSRRLRPGLLHIPGGGWSWFDPDVYRDVCLALAEQTQATVVSVNYRKAPEHLFPAAIDDCIKVAIHFQMNAGKYGVDAEKIGIAGDSAGGNLAMATALHLAMNQEPGRPSLKLQGLIYPILQGFDFNLPSYIAYSKGPGALTKQLMVEFTLFYLFGERSLYGAFATNQHTSPSLKKSSYGSYVSTVLLPERIQRSVRGPQRNDFGNETLSRTIEHLLLNPLFSPLMAADRDLSLLPPTFMQIAEVDVLRDEGLAAVERLRKVKVPVTLSHEMSEEHGFMSNVMLESTRKNIALFGQFFRDIMLNI